MEVIVITASWDVHLGFIKYHCRRLLRKGIPCEVTMINNNDAKELLIKYGVKNGIIRIPTVLVLSKNGVNVIDVYQLRSL
ncbi:hypothetical protein [Caldivirga maquilingensis]|uniref:Thioredoxin-like fold domain-containing protein n=1 Tax=Caldivirga maquilingensis (strain ATCC 700844 / DSM 13496 / JCM 10307 / IC-167) TaxID=397948 RepID=A8MCX7_CALMQ|nr:hypothetical protein [Caldivirga maquilingensis]ABW01633.1 hypothetical protein Cmaq_0798 [Caldivirga maquilingensis IC-167]